jgi:hypothetical protein
MKRLIETILLILIFGTLAFTGCTLFSPEVTCPEFDEEILNWVPYQKSDVIELYSQSKDSTIKFYIYRVEVTHTTHYETGVDCKGSCDDNILIAGHDYYVPHINYYFEVNMELTKNKINSQKYHIDDSDFYSYSEINNFTFEDEEYASVRVFEKTDSKGTFKKLIIAKEIGIIGLIDIYDNTWVLKSDVKIKRLDEPEEQRKNIEIKNKSGC